MGLPENFLAVFSYTDINNKWGNPTAPVILSAFLFFGSCGRATGTGDESARSLCIKFMGPENCSKSDPSDRLPYKGFVIDGSNKSVQSNTLPSNVSSSSLCRGSIKNLKPSCRVPEWLKKAQVKNETVSITELQLTRPLVWWHGGIWKGGTWNGDTWEKGTWENGTWNGDSWLEGVWNDGYWNEGYWYSGTWNGGIWNGGIWKGGTWKGGVWKGGTWKGGTWKGGTWKGGVWGGGTWKDGTWEGGTWEGGTWLSSEKRPEKSSLCPLDFSAFKQCFENRAPYDKLPPGSKIKYDDQLVFEIQQYCFKKIGWTQSFIKKFGSRVFKICQKKYGREIKNWDWKHAPFIYLKL